MGLLPAALACFVSLSFAAAVVIPVFKAGWAHESSGWLTGVLYILGVAAGIWILKKTDPFPDKVVSYALIGLGVVLKAAVVLLSSNLPLNVDQALFKHFSSNLAEGGFGEATLATLSRFYDYPLWTGRSFPVHYFVERWGGGHVDGLLKTLNIFATSLILVLTHSLACHVLPAGKRKWAVFVLLVLPFQTFWATDYSHHLYSSLYLLTFAWCASSLACRRRGAIGQMALSGLAAVCLLLMAWQGGVDLIAAALAAVMVVVHFILRSSLRRSLLLALLLLAVPLGVAKALKGPLLGNRIAGCDQYRQNSVLPAFLARGWCPATGGEYNPRYEQLDRATPWPQKPVAMIRLVWSQIRHEPFKTCFLLPCIKTAKLFLAGYASNFEESLALARSPALPRIRWLRRCGTIVFLGFVLVGCIRLAGGGFLRFAWLPVVLVPVLTWGAYVLAGETSPRYSVFFQPFLAIVGGLAFCGNGRCPRMNWRLSASRALAVVCILVCASAGVALAGRLLPEDSLYVDLRESSASDATLSGANPIFERLAVLKAGEDGASFDWLVPSKAKTLSFYLLESKGLGEEGRMEIALPNGETLLSFVLSEIPFPKYVEVTLPADVPELRVSVFRSPAVSGMEGALAFGYLLWSES